MKTPAKVKVKQRDVTDCGAACLASVAAYYELGVSIAKLRQWAGTDRKGTSAWGLIKAAERLGMSGKGIKAMPGALNEIPLPAIVHVIVNEKLHHYVVVYGVSPEHLVIMDPANGTLEKRSKDDFLREWTGIVILLAPTRTFISGNQKVSHFSRFHFLLYPHRFILMQALLGSVIFTVLGLSTSVYIQKITDYVLLNGNRNLLNLLSLAMLVILLFQILIGTLQTVMVLKTGQLIDARLITGYYRHLLRLPQSFFDSMRTGEIVSRINDAIKIRAFINDALVNFVVNFFILLFAFILMFIYSWKLAFIMVMVIPLYAIIYWVTDKLNRKQERKIMEQAAELESQLIESVNSIKTIKQLAIEDFANIKTEIRFIPLLLSAYRSGINSLFSSNASLTVSRLFTIILLWVGSYYVMDKEITPGELMSFYALVGYFTGPVSGVIGLNKVYQNARIAADRLFEIMDLSDDEKEHMIEASEISPGDVVFRNVCFGYGTRENVLNDFSAVFRKGEVTALVGESGSGKSTIASLLLKLYPLNRGTICIGETNIGHIGTESLRRLIGIVSQNPDLFSGTIASNIAIGENYPDMGKILTISEHLGLKGFVESLPSGYNTYIGEQGAALSGGQQQRLAIARILYREPEIFVLDEATSSLDSESESYVHAIIRQLRLNGKTVVLIAHRLSSIVNADKIIVVKNGQVAEEGDHKTLLSLKGLYYSAWQKQFPAEEWKD